ncbi:MAG: SAM-dependent chlorinase/fluorinase [Nitrospirota bacterium]|nr:SAM-dependent chlorinase/fluorinase [Nitrospirota bacterium]
MPLATPLITLLTDFGERDYFVASMKGVILNINPQARIVDLSHHVTAHDVTDAAYLLKSCYRYFPDGTIHVAVVDPGVGSQRRPLLVSSSRYFFIGPDNGVFTHVCQEESGVEVRQIENRQYRLDSDGATFDGRDLFAPAAAWLTKGQSIGSFGRLVPNYERLSIPEPAWDKHVMAGQIVYIDRFGNLISNLTAYHLKEVRGLTKRSDPYVRIGGHTIDGVGRSYAEGSPDQPQALMNSNGYVEVFVKEGRAAERLNVSRGARIELC